MILSLYHYTAIITDTYDGDTVTAKIDLGLDIWTNEKLRLARINAPELYQPDREAGHAARDYLRGLVKGKEVRIETIKDRKGKYGRYLAEIWLEQDDGWLNVNDDLVFNGHAEFKDY